MGTSAARALITVPCPPWVTTADACSSTSLCGARSTTVTFAGASIASTGRSRAGGDEAADRERAEGVDGRRRRLRWSM